MKSTSRLGRKQRVSHEDFLAALGQIETLVPYDQYRALRDRTVQEIVNTCPAGVKVAFGWSGGKDAEALRVVCYRAGISRCVLGMTNHLEYVAFLRWVTDNMPPGLTIIKNSWDLKWLADHQDMLFPQTAATAAKWFSGVQHYAQAKYFETEKLGMILLGRRKADGNFVGRGGSNVYTSEGITRYSPLSEWTHEDVLACLHYESLSKNLAPFYSWPRGFRCGTHAWPARQWCQGIPDGWREVYSIEPDRVKEAATLIQSARDFLRTIGVSP